MHRLFNRGFTWLEIVVVTVILIFLASLIIPRYHVDGDSKIRKAKVQITEIVKALELYKQDNGFYPTTEQGLMVLVEEPSTGPEPEKWRQYLDRYPVDPWRRPFIYICLGSEEMEKEQGRSRKEGPVKCYDLKSKGFDGIEGSKDDIDCWNLDAVCD
ncbi:MAG: type II secretion system major pseudopilin GspG [Vulcanimicrobiota bacterium]